LVYEKFNFKLVPYLGAAPGERGRGGGRGSHINRTEVLVRNLEKNLHEVPRSCFVGILIFFFSPKRYQF